MKRRRTGRMGAELVFPCSRAMRSAAGCFPWPGEDAGAVDGHLPAAIVQEGGLHLPPTGIDRLLGGLPDGYPGPRSPEAVARRLRHQFDGRLHLPGAVGYDAGRLAWRRDLDQQPLLVAEVADAADVARAVITAREFDVPVGVQATGHGTVRPTDDGVLLNLSRMTYVDIDPVRATARVGGGARWGDVVAAAARFGLAPISGSSSALGVAGYTLGGGVGWLSRRHGFAADSLLRAEVVTAAGTRLVAGPDDDVDLWWALRGGGGNFGVVTELLLRLYPVGEVFGGVAYFPGERAGAILACHRDHAADLPDELTTALTLLRLPDGPAVPGPLRGRTVVALRVCHTGPVARGRRALAPLLAVAGPPLLGGYGPMTWPQTSALDDPQPGPQIVREHTDLFRAMSDELIDVLLAEIGGSGASRSPISVIELRHVGGALARPSAEGGPSGHRDATYALIAVAPRLHAAQLSVARGHMAAFARRLRPYATRGVLLNFLSDPSRTMAAYRPADLGRLAALKRIYDPENIFHRNHNIPPGP
ncbi:FAD-binding oxidoreductase [Micromonospora inyonensis]|uniref:FAD/FMN-containing dehydrogenase n=1 Tax=Micromonospora inyonensis TaxID=47866 RepID=A0A1C6SLE7_9ACTN|nr:FAD-binding oxidoreductase [Micromonospora inyonensis]SCL30350.1 FAD/FMN-containing dehydrogenase [Micromonospora inyonensis]